ncbi:ABC transporter ATP-binding protein [Leucobacter sp. wl10]|nr:ABC transporter ATP-binding protein [Leucobacter sp. wl10]RGE19826.1 ABC transporter ATP-binding protein [Leucobacter sp. wl10]
MSTSQLSATDLVHAYPGGPTLFEPLSFSIEPGEIVGICGPSGSGKSTLLSLIAGWEVPQGGTINRIAIDSIRWVFQNPHGVPHRTALDHVVFPLLCRGTSRGAAEEEAASILSTFALTSVAGRAFHMLSGGEAQRLMLARAVAAAPDLLLVDEPTAQLDQRTAASVNETLGGIAESGAIVVIATHDPGTRSACSRVIELDPATDTQ